MKSVFYLFDYVGWIVFKCGLSCVCIWIGMFGFWLLFKVWTALPFTTENVKRVLLP